MAFSLDSFEPGADYGPAADLAAELTELILRRDSVPGRVINVNFPDRDGLSLADCVVARQGLTMMKESFVERRDPRGNLYYWQDWEEVRVPNGGPEEIPTDQEVLAAGKVPLTPIRFDLTHHRALETLKNSLLG